MQTPIDYPRWNGAAQKPHYEVRALIQTGTSSGEPVMTEYTESYIVSAQTSAALFSSPGVGNAVSRQLDLTILPYQSTTPSRMGKIKLQVRGRNEYFADAPEEGTTTSYTIKPASDGTVSIHQVRLRDSAKTVAWGDGEVSTLSTSHWTETHTYADASQYYTIVVTGTHYPLDAIYGYSELTSLVIGSGANRIMDDTWTLKQNTGLTSLSFNGSGPVDGYHFGTIPDELFMETGLTGTVTIADSVETIGERAFQDTAITEFTLGCNLTSLGDDAFSGCSITKATIRCSTPPHVYDADTYGDTGSTVFWVSPAYRQAYINAGFPAARLQTFYEFTDWMDKGTFYIDTREKDYTTNQISLTAYDSMLKAEYTYFTTGTWTSQTLSTIITTVANEIGVTLEELPSYTMLDSVYCGYPNDYTGRELLAYIAGLMGGNFCITEQDTLRFVPYKASATVSQALGNKCSALELGTAFDAVASVSVEKGDSTEPTTAGTGEYCLTVKFPVPVTSSATLTTAAAELLTNVSGYAYQPYTASGALLDPRIELGDTISVLTGTSLVSVMAASIKTEYGRLMLSKVSAAFDNEVDHEYPYVDSQTRSLTKVKDSIQTELGVLESSIYSNVSGTNKVTRSETAPTSAAEGDLWYCLSTYTSGTTTYTAETMYKFSGSTWQAAEVDASVSVAPDFSTSSTYSVGDVVTYNKKWWKCTTAVTTAGAWDATKWTECTTISQVSSSQISQTMSNITLGVTSGSSGTKISLTSGGVTVDSSVVDLNVKAVNINGTITADAINLNTASITGSLTASHIDASDLEVDSANITGTLTASQIELGGEMTVYTTDGGSVSGGSFGYITGESSSGEATRGVGIMDDTDSGQCIVTSAGAKLAYGSDSRVVCTTSAVSITGDTYVYYAAETNHRFSVNGSNVMFVGGSSCRPAYNAGLDLGASNYTWDNAYCSSGAWSGSDRNIKKDIVYNYDMDGFFDDLKPCSYKFIDGTSGRTHYGLIAQDVEDNLTEHGMTGTDFAGFGKAQKRDEDDRPIEGYDYFLRYEEFISLLIDQVQKLKARVDELERGGN